jgi:hypothetical protein
MKFSKKKKNREIKTCVLVDRLAETEVLVLPRALVHSLEQSDRFNLIFGDGRTLLRKKKVSVEKLVKTRELKFSKGKSAGANWC